MDIPTVIYLALSVVAGALVAWLLLRRSGATPTAGGLLAAAQDAFVVAQTLVAAAEQMADTGTITKDARFNYVFTRLRELFPALSEDVLIAAIEGAVWLVTKGVALVETPED